MQIWMLIALYFSFMALMGVLSRSPSLAWLSADKESGFPVSYVRWADALLTFVMFGLPALIYANVFPMERFRWFRLGGGVKPVVALFGVIAILSFSFVADRMQQISQSFVTNPETIKALKNSEENVRWVLDMPGVGDLLMLLFVSAFVPAFFEELFFRGCLQQLFVQWRSKSPQSAVWITALLFALAHGNPVNLVPIFFAGLMLGYAFYWTGSLRINILMHFSFNALSIGFAYWSQHSASIAEWEPAGWFTALCAAVAFVSFGLVLRFSRNS